MVVSETLRFMHFAFVGQNAGLQNNPNNMVNLLIFSFLGFMAYQPLYVI